MSANRSIKKKITASLIAAALALTLTTSGCGIFNKDKDENNTALTSKSESVEIVKNQALASSSSVVPSFAAQVKRTANIWIWFVLVAVILGAIAFVMLKRDKKKTRYQKYVDKKKKAPSTRAQLSARW